jgi:hypothetical protein
VSKVAEVVKAGAEAEVPLTVWLGCDQPKLELANDLCLLFCV